MPTTYALLELLQDDGSLTVSTLAERLAIDRTNVSRLCARLEASGDVELIPHQDDKRARNLRLTKKGRSLAQGVDAASAAHFTRVSAQLDGPVDEVVSAIERLEQAIVKAEGTP